MLETIFCHIDDFCNFIEKEFNKKLLCDGAQRQKTSRMTASEVMTLSVMYHYSGYKTFKKYYIEHVCKYQKEDFPKLVSYTRFIELKSKLLVVQNFFVQELLGKCTGLSIIDSFPLKVCNNKRISSHKVFKPISQRGKSSMGWFYGFKLHIIVNALGEIIQFKLTPGNVSDNNKPVAKFLTKDVSGKVIADKGYIGLTNYLKPFGIEFIHGIRKNMKKTVISEENKKLLKKRGRIETIGGILKDHLNLDHARHRSLAGFCSHVISTIIAYCFWPEKPCIYNKTLSA